MKLDPRKQAFFSDHILPHSLAVRLRAEPSHVIVTMDPRVMDSLHLLIYSWFVAILLSATFATAAS